MGDTQESNPTFESFVNKHNLLLLMLRGLASKIEGSYNEGDLSHSYGSGLQL